RGKAAGIEIRFLRKQNRQSQDPCLFSEVTVTQNCQRNGSQYGNDPWKSFCPKSLWPLNDCTRNARRQSDELQLRSQGTNRLPSPFRIFLKRPLQQFLNSWIQIRRQEIKIRLSHEN